MKPVIEVSGISKSYRISHQDEMKSDYSTLKDDFSNLLKRPFGGGEKINQETFWALKDISFQVNQGDFFGIIGKNGSGKSTMLKILSRIVSPTTGSVKIHGRVASLLEVGTGFHQELTGRENIFFNGSMLGMSRQEIRKKFDDIVAFSEIEKFLDTPVKFYSSGMFVRLAFSVAAHLDPEILILDEVLSVGDPGFQKKSMDKMLSFSEDGRTILFVSHSMAAVRQLCNKGVLLNNGRVNIVGETDDLIDKYTDILAAESPDTVAKSSWEAKKIKSNEYFVPTKIYITDLHGKKMNGHLKHAKEYWFCIEGDLETENEKFNVGYSVRNRENNLLLYMSMSTDGPQTGWPRLKKGKVTFRGKIPGRVLNGGNYRFSLIASLHNEAWIFDLEDETPGIDVDIDTAISASPYWVNARSGAIAPINKWEIR